MFFIIYAYHEVFEKPLYNIKMHHIGVYDAYELLNIIK